jgi:hypothetical protein
VVTAVPESRAAAPEDAILGSVPAEVFEPERIEEAVAVVNEINSWPQIERPARLPS